MPFGHIVSDPQPFILDAVYLPNVGNFALSGQKNISDLSNQLFTTNQQITLGTNPISLTAATVSVSAGITISGKSTDLYNGAFWCDQLLLANGSKILMSDYLVNLGLGAIYIVCNQFVVTTAATLTTGAGNITIMTKKYTAGATITRNIQGALGVLSPDTNAKIYEIDPTGTITTLRDFNSSWDNT